MVGWVGGVAAVRKSEQHEPSFVFDFHIRFLLSFKKMCYAIDNFFCDESLNLKFELSKYIYKR